MELLRNGRPRVVITGLGAVTALGSVPELWENILAGNSGIRRLETINTEHVTVKIGGEVRGFDPTKYIDRKEARRMGRASHFTIAAAQMAAEDAGYTTAELEKVGERVSVVVGTSLGAHEMSEKSTTKYKTDGYRKPNPLNMINALPNMPAHYVSRYMRAFGPLITPSAACASGTQSVGEGMELIRHGRADIVFAGGVEAIMQDYVLEAFYAMTALATEYNDNPAAASRPFDLNRSGFCLSEGAAIVVLESLAHALKRGAHIYAEVIGHASSSDAYHVAALDPEGLGAYRSMKWALEDAHLDTEQIQYINAHGTSTPANDLMETQAIKRLFGEYAYELWVSSTKSMLGHAMAASGAIETVLLAKILEERVVPPTINYETPDPECDLDYVPNEAREMPDLEYVMSNSFGLGGQNATLVMRRFNQL